MFVVDTNVLVYAANVKSFEHRQCRTLLDNSRGSSLPWYATWGILYEFLRIVTHPRVFDPPWLLRQANSFVAALLAAPSLGLLLETPRHQEVLAQTVGEIPDLRGNLLHDAHTAVLMREHGIRRIYTRDSDFHRFPFLEVIDPMNA